MIPAAREKCLELTLDVKNTLPQQVYGDPTRFEQILMNLLSNAIKFTDTGSVKLSLEWTPETPAGTLHVCVIDTGIGIPKEKLGRLFHKFTQIDSSITRRYGGTGLGLAICKRLVEFKGGRIGAQSKVGIGTTIWFRLPFEPCPADTQQEVRDFSTLSDKHAKPGMGLHVLLAEDMPINRKLAITILKKLGCTVDTVKNGREAVHKSGTEKYDLIYMDCQMPEMDGFEATLEIRKREAAQGAPHTPIIAVTANALEGDRERCHASGMDDYISKPFAQTDFAHTLRQWKNKPSQA
ncbi:MAG: ATP-binding protein [Chthoniobacterales bacterium]